MRRQWPLLALALLLGACSSGARFHEVEFTVPPQPDPALRPFLGDAHRIGVFTATNIKSVQQLDVEKVMARLSGALSRHLARLPGVTVVPEEEIRWRVHNARVDTGSVVTADTRQALMDTLHLDALVVVELQRMEARVTPVAPSGYSSYSGTSTATQGLDMAVSVRLSVVNLHDGHVWQQTGSQRNWQPVRLQVFGGDQSELQLLQALGVPLERFLLRLAPPPRVQVRQFEVSGN